MVDHPALGVDTTQTRAGVHTVKTLACLVTRTVCIDGALRSACQVGVSEVVRNAGACCRPVPVGADGVFPAGRGVAGVRPDCGDGGCG